MKWQELSLKTKLISGFSIIIILMFIIAVISFSELNKHSGDFNNYREMALDTNIGGRIQANLLTARISAVNYIKTGSNKSLEEFNKRWDTLLDLHKSALDMIKKSEWHSTIESVGKDLKQYRKGFEQIVGYQNLRNRLLNETLNIKGPLMENSLTDIMISANSDGDLTASYYTGLTMKHLLLARLYMAKFLDTNQQKDIDRVNIEFKKMFQNIDILNKELENPKRRELLKIVLDSQKIYSKAFFELADAIFKRNKVTDEILVKLGIEVSDKIEILKLDIKKVQEEIGPRLQASNQSAIVLISCISFISVGLGIFIVVKIINGVMAKLGGDPGEIEKIAESIAKGELTINFRNNSKKDIGVYSSMKLMAHNLSTIIKDITNGVKKLDASSGELSAVSEQMASGVDQTANISNNVASASEEISANMNTVAAATEQTTANIQSIVTAVEEMSVTINEIASNTAKGSQTTAAAVTAAKDVSEKVNDLGRAASQINKVTETIADISDQTNLLALNATIEASRAGEAGKGFAVVAGEIKALAQQTAEATSEISGKIADVQSTSEESVSAIESIVTIVNEVNDIVTTVATAIEEQSLTTQEITSNITHAAEGVNEVNINVTQASSVVNEVTSDILKLNTATQDVKAGGIQVESRAGELADLAKKLNKMVQQFSI